MVYGYILADWDARCFIGNSLVVLAYISLSYCGNVLGYH